MNAKEIGRNTLAEIVREDHVRAYVLYYFGIRFYQYSERTLDDVCRAHGLQVSTVLQQFESPRDPAPGIHDKLSGYPIQLVIEYLRHAHYIFVKKRLPYIQQLIESVSDAGDEWRHISRDLRTLFPLFVEDFIKHIYDEEDTLFSYIRDLDKADRSGKTGMSLYYSMERHSLRKFAIEHEVHDDELKGIREITNNYQRNADTPLHMGVIYSELMALEESLIQHARIENEILFPKALLLETRLREKIARTIALN